MIDEPIFIMAVSPRCGSTWIQRCLTSTGDVLIWGETWSNAYPGGDLWSRPDEASPDSGLDYYKKHKEEMFMATLLPYYQDAVVAYKRLCEDLYGRSAEKEGFSRWGKKETMWSNADCNFIRAAWPKSKIIFLVREFDLSYMSQFKNLAEVPGRDRAEEVRKMASQWVEHMRVAKIFENPNHAMIVKYETMYSGTEEEKKLKLISLCRWCGIEKEPNWKRCSKMVSAHKYPEHYDLRSYRPCDLDVLWPYRDDIIKFSKMLNHKQVLGVKI